VGVNIEHTNEGTINMTQPNIIKSILHKLNFMDNTKPADTPASGGTIITDGTTPHKADWHYSKNKIKLTKLITSIKLLFTT
jgi:hypothetical protein